MPTSNGSDVAGGVAVAYTFAAAFRMAAWRLRLRARRDFDLGPWPAGILRGAVGVHLLRTTACPFPAPNCETCDRRPWCVWPTGFRPVAGPDERYRDPPAPFVIAWPGRKRGGAGEASTAELTLIGRAVETWPAWRAALEVALATGLGRERATFDLLDAEPLDPPHVPAGDRIGLDLTTPLELKRRGRRLDVFDAPSFTEAVLRRLDVLHRTHSGAAPIDRDRIRCATRLDVLGARTRVARAERYSRSHDDIIQARGIVGRVVLGGELTALAPLLAIGTRVGVGSGAAASWGCGRIALFDPA